MEKIYTLFVNSYSLKYSKNNDLIRISIPNYGVVFSDNSISLPDELKMKLKGIGWKNAAVDSLEKKIILPSDRKWKNFLRINISSGKLSYND